MANSTKVDITTAFNAGEFTPALAGRIDFQDYKYSARFVENFLPEVQGGLKKFYGTRKIAVINKPDDYLMVPFDALDEPVVLVFHDNAVSVIDGDDYYDTDMSITVAGLRKLNWVQQNSVMYFAHPTTPPFSIRCYGRGDDSKLIFSIEEISFIDVPYFPMEWSGNFNGEITTDAETGTVHVSAGTTVTLKVKLPDSIAGTSGAINTLRPNAGSGIPVLVKKLGSDYTVTLGDTKVQLIRKRNGVESVVTTVSTGVMQVVEGVPDH